MMSVKTMELAVLGIFAYSALRYKTAEQVWNKKFLEYTLNDIALVVLFLIVLVKVLLNF